jgi:hypothetical protein
MRSQNIKSFKKPKGMNCIMAKRHVIALVATITLSVCNVVSQAVSDQAVSDKAANKQDMPSTQVQAWRLPEQALFFLPDAAIRWEQIPAENHEWILAGRLSENLFRVIGIGDVDYDFKRGNLNPVEAPDAKKEAQGQALAEWSQCVRSEWLPKAEMIIPAQLERQGARLEKQMPKVAAIAFCPLTYKGTNLLYTGRLGNNLWLYLEQPDPLPPGMAPLTAADVLRPDILQRVPSPSGEAVHPRVEFQSRVFMRYRAFVPKGPYQRVRILLIHFRLPETLNLRSPGYP